jgi:hypothetical protein
MKKIAAAIILCFALVGCASLQQKIDIATGVYKAATETTVPAEVVIPTANAFNILKAGATNYGRYCIQQRMAPSMCSASTRRIVIKAVRSGTAARNSLEDSVANNEPALSSVYNILVVAVNSLQKTPAANSQFTEAAR